MNNVDSELALLEYRKDRIRRQAEKTVQEKLGLTDYPDVPEPCWAIYSALVDAKFHQLYAMDSISQNCKTIDSLQREIPRLHKTVDEYTNLVDVLEDAYDDMKNRPAKPF